MPEQQFKASLSRNQGRNAWCVIFRHPLRKDRQGHAGLRVRRGLGTYNWTEAERLKDEMNELLSNPAWWTPAARENAERLYDSRVVSAFYDYLTPIEHDFWGLREHIIPLPTPDNGYIRVLFVGTTGAGKTTVVRQLLGTDPARERFPSTSAAKTTICDLEVVLTEGAFQAVVTFLPKDRIQVYVEECVIAAVQAALDQKETQDIARKLLEHSEQRFRLSYILGVLPSEDQGDDDEDLEEDEQEDMSEQDALSPQERLHIVTTLQEFLHVVRSLATTIRENLTAHPDYPGAAISKEDRDALIQELLENELYKHDTFQRLVDDIVDTVEERFSFLQRKGHTVFDRGGWPSYWTFETEDREEFLRTINQFSSNYAPLFGRLLTPLVQGIRVTGPFRPAWREGPSPRLVLMDGEGLGHTLDTAMSLSTEITSRFEKADAIVLVDSASQPMQAASSAVLKSVETAGHAAKLLICFTHFDSVEGDNLPTQRAKRNHVLNSLENAITALGREMGLRASATLSNALKDHVFFVSNIQKPLPPDAKMTRAEFNKMVESLNAMMAQATPREIKLFYDKIYLFSFIQRAVKSFHEAWRGRLGLTVQSSRYPEHWTRIKALSRRPARLGLDEYDRLRPVADLIRELSEQIRAFLMKPQKWEPADGSEEMQQAAIDGIARDIYTRLHALARKRLIKEHWLEWETAYTRWGIGSAKERAQDLELIYNLAVPIVGEFNDDVADEFLASVVELVGEAVRSKGGELW
jgi:GTPase Era involved in 16S rRNA processing